MLYRNNLGRVQPFIYTSFLSAEVKLNDPWSVGAGENSKEVEAQTNRNRREKETVYQVAKEIPPNPKEPWDRELDFDDTLTPVILAEQLPEGDAMETQIASPSERENGVVTASQSRAGDASTTEPDLELLAVLLKNPELVIALTSGQVANNMSSADTVKLLDMIKAGSNATTSFNGVVNKQVEEKVEVSLPSPTPPSNPGTVRHFGLYANLERKKKQIVVMTHKVFFFFF